jgi:hypothetical protein
MRRREFIAAIGGAAAWPFAARAQQGDRMRRVGVLMYEGENDPDGKARLSAFTQGVAESAWTERRNVHIDVFGSVELHQSYQPTTLWIVTVRGATMVIVPVRRMVSGLLRLQLLHELLPVVPGHWTRDS